MNENGHKEIPRVFLVDSGSKVNPKALRQIKTAQGGKTSVRASVSSFRHKMHSSAVKIISLVSLFALTFVSGVLPLKLRSGRGPNNVDRRQESRDRRRRQLISLATCFAGGAFFASSMLGLLPVVQREFKDLLDEAMIKTEFPVPEFSVSVGFFMILIVEQIIYVLKEKQVKWHSEVCSEDSRSPLLGNSKDTFSGASFVKHGKKENITERENIERESGESDDEAIVNLHHHHHAHHHHGDAGNFDHTSIENHVNQNPHGYQSPHTHPDDHGNYHEDFDHHHAHHHDHHRDGDVGDLDNHVNQSPRAYQSQHTHNDPHDPSYNHKDFDHHHNHHRDGDASDLHHDHTSIGNQVKQNQGSHQSSHALKDDHDNDHEEDSDHHQAYHHNHHKDGDASDLDHSSIGNHVNQNPGGYQSQHIHPDDHRNDHEDFDHHHDHHRDGDAGDLDHSSIDNHVNQNPGDYHSSNTHSDDHNNDHEDDSHHHQHDHCIFENTSTKHHNERHYLRSYLLLIALSIHALFEGLAVGLFQNIDSMVELLGPLIIHKCILGFSMGVILVQHCFPSFMIVKSSFLFAAMSPIGLGFGILMLTYTSAELGHIFSAIFQAIATGTFLYVTFFEIFFHELNSRECHKLLKAFMMVLGFSLIAVMQFFDTKINSD